MIHHLNICLANTILRPEFQAFKSTICIAILLLLVIISGIYLNICLTSIKVSSISSISILHIRPRVFVVGIPTANINHIARISIHTRLECWLALVVKFFRFLLLTINGTLNISISGLKLNTWFLITPSKSQLILGTHFMALGHLTYGFVSAGCD